MGRRIAFARKQQQDRKPAREVAIATTPVEPYESLARAGISVVFGSKPGLPALGNAPCAARATSLTPGKPTIAPESRGKNSPAPENSEDGPERLSSPIVWASDNTSVST